MSYLVDLLVSYGDGVNSRCSVWYELIKSSDEIMNISYELVNHSWTNYHMNTGVDINRHL